MSRLSHSDKIWLQNFKDLLDYHYIAMYYCEIMSI